MKQIVFKNKVKIPLLTEPILYAMMKILSIWKWDDKTPVITSMNDGVHMRKSLHYENLAFDLRTYYFKGGYQGDEAKEFHKDLKEALGPDWDVLLEKTHIHVEFDPEVKEKKKDA